MLVVGLLDGVLRFYKRDGSQPFVERKLVPRPPEQAAGGGSSGGASSGGGASGRSAGLARSDALGSSGAGSLSGGAGGSGAGPGGRARGGLRALASGKNFSLKALTTFGSGRGGEAAAAAAVAVAGAGAQDAWLLRDGGVGASSSGGGGAAGMGPCAWADPLSLAFYQGAFLLVAGTDR